MKTMNMVLAGLLVAVGTVGADILWSEDFESYPTNPYEVGGANDVNGWSDLNYQSNQRSTIGTYGGGTGSYPKGSQNLYFVDNNTDAGVANYAMQNNSASISNAGNVVVSFDFNARSGDQNPTFDLYSGGTSGTRALQLNFISGTGRFQYHDGSTQHILLNNGSMVEDKWYHVELTLSDLTQAGDTFDVVLSEWTESTTLSEVFSANGLSFRAEVDFIDSFRFGTVGAPATAGSKYNIDNIVFETIPEPATLGLMGIVGAGLIVARRFVAM